MISPSIPSGGAGRPRISVARWCAIAFSVFSLWVLYGAYVSYCVLPKIYKADSQIQIVQPHDPASPDPIAAEIAFIRTSDVMSPIVTDLELDKIWAKRVYKSGLDQLPMQDALSFLGQMLHIRQVPGTRIIDISASSEVPREAADIANAVADRYLTLRANDQNLAFADKERVLGQEVEQQQEVVGQKTAAIETIRSQLQQQGIQAVPGIAGLMAADLAAQKNGVPAQVEAFAPLHAAEAQLDAQQHALDALLLRQRQDKADYQLCPNPVRIIARAGPPEYPSSPNQSLNLMINIVVGSGLAVLIATLCEIAFWYLAPVSPGQTSIPRPASTSEEY